MVDVHDLFKTTLTLKANERMIAFAGFFIRPEQGGPDKEGVLKISSYQGKSGVGQLTLTFMVDVKEDQQTKWFLGRTFRDLTEETFRPHLGGEMVSFVKVPLGSVFDTHNWHIEELNLHFRSLQGRERRLVDERLIPVLSNVLPFDFEPVEWWTEGLEDQSPFPLPDKTEFREPFSIKTFFRKWFGSDKQ